MWSHGNKDSKNIGKGQQVHGDEPCLDMMDEPADLILSKLLDSFSLTTVNQGSNQVGPVAGPTHAVALQRGTTNPQLRICLNRLKYAENMLLNVFDVSTSDFLDAFRHSSLPLVISSMFCYRS